MPPTLRDPTLESQIADLLGRLFHPDREAAEVAARREVDLEDRHHSLKGALGALADAQDLEHRAALLWLQPTNTVGQHAAKAEDVRGLRAYAQERYKHALLNLLKALTIAPEGAGDDPRLQPLDLREILRNRLTQQ